MNSQFVGGNGVSAAEQELIENGNAFSSFEFYNNEECNVRINNSENILLKAGQGFRYSSKGSYIFRFVIVTDGIDYNFIAEK